MKKRLVEMFKLNDRVEIYLRTTHGDDWQPGRVIQLDHPGVWVEIDGGSHWFVTNRQKIRRSGQDGWSGC
ncbi:MAG: hypothetical protein WAM60_03355 [Candidatus Promineifilaceae bacterium]